MDQKELEELKQKLGREQARLRSALGAVAREEGGSYTPKFEEMGDDPEAGEDEAEQFRINVGTEKELEAMLARVEHALNKISRGVYGVCEKCGADIAVERLKAAPEAEYCMEHAQQE